MSGLDEEVISSWFSFLPRLHIVRVVFLIHVKIRRASEFCSLVYVRCGGECGKCYCSLCVVALFHYLLSLLSCCATSMIVLSRAGVSFVPRRRVSCATVVLSLCSAAPVCLIVPRWCVCCAEPVLVLCRAGVSLCHAGVFCAAPVCCLSVPRRAGLLPSRAVPVSLRCCSCLFVFL